MAVNDPVPSKQPPNQHFYASEVADTMEFPIGLPPVELYFSNDVLEATIPVMEIIPGQGVFTQGMDLFTFESLMNAKGGFKDKILDTFNIQLPDSLKSIPVAFMADSIPGIQLNNEYGASFLQNIAEVANPLLGQLGQIFGSGTNVIKTVGTGLKDLNTTLGGKQGGIAERGIAGLLGGVDWLTNQAETQSTKHLGKFGGLLNAGVSAAANMLGGARVDFPKVWMGSSFSGPVSVTVRLYNQDQANDNAYMARIVAPLAILLTLAAPLSDSDNLYRWPYIHRIFCKGMFFWKMAAMVGLSVNLGPENSMSWNQRPSLVDVRMDFIPLHQVMLNSASSINMPSVGDYIDQLKDGTQAPKLWDVPPGAPVFHLVQSDDDAPDLKTVVGTPTKTNDPNAARNPAKRTDPTWIDKVNGLASSAQKTAGDYIAKQEAAVVAAFKGQNLQQASDTQAAKKANTDAQNVKTLQDQMVQNNLARPEGSAIPTTTLGPVGGTPGNPGGVDSQNQAVKQKTMDPETAYYQSLDGAPPGSVAPVPATQPTTGGQAPGKTTAPLAGIPSNLEATGTTKVGTGGLTECIVNAGSVNAGKSTGQDIKPATTPTTTVSDARKAEEFPTSQEIEAKEKVTPTAAQTQENQQAMASEMSSENQNYQNISSGYQAKLSTLDLQKATGQITVAEYRAQYYPTVAAANELLSSHRQNLTNIANKYKV